MDRYLIDYFLDGTWVAVDGDVFEYAMENNEFDFWYRYVPSGKYNFESDGMYYASSGTRFAAWDYISYNEIVITFESDGRAIIITANERSGARAETGNTTRFRPFCAILDRIIIDKEKPGPGPARGEGTRHASG